MNVIVGIIIALVLLDTIDRWLHPEDYRVRKQARDWRAKGRKW